MALVTTTLGAAMAAGDTKATVASATSVAAGRVVLVDGEYMVVRSSYVSGSTTVPVRRGQQGTAQVAHVSGAEFTHGATDDYANPPPGSVVAIGPSTGVRRVSYSAAGAIALPAVPGEELFVTLNGTDALAMTLADPDEAINGAVLHLDANGAAAHTITSASGFGGAGSSYDVLTANGTGTIGFDARASGGLWVLVGQVTGTLTNVAAAIA